MRRCRIADGTHLINGRLCGAFPQGVLVRRVAIADDTSSAAAFTGSVARCAYRAVVATCVCPSSLPIIGSPRPAATAAEANVWRRSWMRASLSPARAPNPGQPTRTQLPLDLRHVSIDRVGVDQLPFPTFQLLLEQLLPRPFSADLLQLQDLRIRHRTGTPNLRPALSHVGVEPAEEYRIVTNIQVAGDQRRRSGRPRVDPHVPFHPAHPDTALITLSALTSSPARRRCSSSNSCRRRPSGASWNRPSRRRADRGSAAGHPGSASSGPSVAGSTM